MDVVESRLDNRAAEALEPRHVQRDVVVDEEDGAGAASARVSDVGEHAREVERMEIAAPHLDDRAEAAVVGATARRFDDVDGTPEEGISRQHTGRSIGQRQLTVRQPRHRARRVVNEGARWPAERQAVDRLRILVARERAQQRAKGQLPFTPDDEVDAAGGVVVGLWCEARIVAAGNDGDVRLDAPNQPREPQRRAALERHDRKTDDLRVVLAHQPFDGGHHAILDEDQVGDGDAVTGPHVARERSEGPVRHAHGERRRVLEGVRHGEEQYAHVRCSVFGARCSGPVPVAQDFSPARPGNLG